jgi:DNA-binding NtrC family response regulator
MRSARVLIVEDDDSTLFGYQRYLNSKGYAVKTATSLCDAKQLIGAESYDVVLLDLRLPDGESLPLISEIAGSEENTAIIVISGLNDVTTAVEAMKLGAHNYLTKPIDLENLDITLKKALELENLRRRDAAQRRLASGGPQPYFGSSEKIQEIQHFSTVAAESDSVVLLLGDTGTGKGVLARWIHDHSGRKDKPFVELNCSSLKGELLKSELYGHAKGSFTSALRDRAGFVEIADGGTLFLDEIGDMDLSVQAELLKTIEEKTYRRIGENKVRSSNFRLICATNSDLAKAAQRGDFRSDLYYRICVFPISLPSLQEREEDIPGLAAHLLQAMGYKTFPLNPEVVEMLGSHSWPGNIRELRNSLERAMLLSRGGALEPAHFPDIAKIPRSDKEIIAPTWNLEEAEKIHILRALEYFKEDKNRVSKALGISLSSLYRRLQSMNKETIPA